MSSTSFGSESGDGGNDGGSDGGGNALALKQGARRARPRRETKRLLHLVFPANCRRASALVLVWHGSVKGDAKAAVWLMVPTSLMPSERNAEIARVVRWKVFRISSIAQMKKRHTVDHCTVLFH